MMIRKFQISDKHIPVFILMLCVFSYGSTLLLGYFWDDWFVMWNFHAMGAQGVFESYIMDRPIHGYVLGYLLQILGESPVIWHTAALLIRYAGAIASWLILRQLWPRRSFENALVAVFIALYPGFTQQALPLVYILLVFGAMALWAFSVWLMLYAYQSKRYQGIIVLLSCFLAFFHLALSEYFIGLEFIRPFLLGLVISQTTTLVGLSWRSWLKNIFLNWLPYLATLVIYLIYRLVFFQSGRPATDSGAIIQQIMANPLAELSRRVASMLTDPFEVTILAWIQPLNKFIVEYSVSPRFWWGFMGGFAAITLFVWAFFASLNTQSNSPDSQNRHWKPQAFGLGCVALIFAGLPLWGISREVFLGGLNDRYSFPFIFGSALILASGIVWVARSQKSRTVVAALIIGVTVGFHLWNTYRVFQTDWDNQKGFHSQLSLRAPGLKKGTSIWVIKDPSLLAMEGDYGLAMPVNWIYEPDQHDSQVNYWVFPLTDEFLYRSKIFRTDSGLFFQRPLRNIVFNGNPDQTIVVWFAPPACLKVIDPNQPELSDVLPLPTIALSLAQIDPILYSSAQAQFPVNIFGAQKKDWCYYFEQADLARQKKNWQTAASFADEAAQKRFTPSHDSEWLPFIEAYIYLDRYEDASRLINLIKDGQLSTSKKLICGFIGRISTDSLAGNNPARNEFLQNSLQQSECSISRQ